MDDSDRASEHVEHIDDDGIDKQLPVLDAIANAFDAEYYGAWTFCTLIRGAEWNDGIDEQLPVLDAIANAFDAEYYGAWTFRTLVRGAGRRPAAVYR